VAEASRRATAIADRILEQNAAGRTIPPEQLPMLVSRLIRIRASAYGARIFPAVPSMGDPQAAVRGSGSRSVVCRFDPMGCSPSFRLG